MRTEAAFFFWQHECSPEVCCACNWQQQPASPHSLQPWGDIAADGTTAQTLSASAIPTANNRLPLDIRCSANKEILLLGYLSMSMIVLRIALEVKTLLFHARVDPCQDPMTTPNALFVMG